MPSRYRAWIYWMAVAGAAFTWPLLMVGGAVTIYRVGMAVPDWPTTFQTNMFLYNMFESSWGVFAEHSHRLYGAAVGVVCLLLAGVATWDRMKLRGLIPFVAVATAAVVAAINPSWGALGGRPGLSAMFAAGVLSLAYAVYCGIYRRDAGLGLAWLLLAAVIGQGVLGGFRVNQNSAFLAFLHGCTAQLFFGLMAAVVVIHGRRWLEAPTAVADSLKVRRRGAVTLVLVVCQIILGAYVRHFGSNMAVGLHALLALAVLGHVLPLSIRLQGAAPGIEPVASSARWMVGWVGVQLVLGVVAWAILQPFDGQLREVSPVQALIRVMHQGVGALLLAASVALVMHGWRRLEGVRVPVPEQAMSTQGRGGVVA